MRKDILNKAVIVLALFASACSSKKKLSSHTTVPVVVNAEAKPASLSHVAINNFKTTSVTFNTLSAKARASLNIGGNSNDVSMNLRIKHDEKIWVSITAIAGLEVARALITPDSIQVINRIQGVYLNKPFSFIYRYANRQINFGTLQSLLIGNVLPGTPKAEDSMENINGQNLVKGSSGALLYSLLFNNENKLVENTIRDEDSAQAVKAAYRNFQTLGSMKIPASVSLNSAVQNKPVKIDLEYSGIVLNQEMEFPFSIPKRYDIIR